MSFARVGAFALAHAGLSVAVVGVVLSLYYYFGVIRSVYWGANPQSLAPIRTTLGTKVALTACISGMLILGIAPNGLLKLADQAVQPKTATAQHTAAH